MSSCDESVCLFVQQVQALTPEQIADFRVAFDTFDADGSGSIDADELKTVMRSMGREMSTAEIEELIKNVDEDG